MSADGLLPVRWSSLRNMGRSPAHYKHALIHGVPETAAMRFGAIVHKLALGGHREIVRWEGTRRGKAWDEFRDTHVGQTIVTAEEWEQASAVAAAVCCHPLMAAGLAGFREPTVHWAVSDRACQGTMDLVGNDLLDLKTTTNAAPGWFTWHATRMGYLAQLAWYWDGLMAAGLPKPQRALLVAVEKHAPYCVTVFELTPRALELGRRTYRLLFERLLVCEATNEWPGYSQDIVLLDPPEDVILEVEGEAMVVGEQA